MWASKFWPTRGRNHWPGWRVRVSVEIEPGFPRFLISPPTASAISAAVHTGGFGWRETIMFSGIFFDRLSCYVTFFKRNEIFFLNFIVFYHFCIPILLEIKGQVNYPYMNGNGKSVNLKNVFSYSPVPFYLSCLLFWDVPFH